MRFEFATATRIVFGAGSIRDVPGMVKELGQRPFLVTGKNQARSADLLEALPDAASFPVAGEPTVEDVVSGAGAARAHSADVVVAMGGGSAIDAGKAIAALLGNGSDLFEHLEVVGKGKPLLRPSVPFVAVPTTAGTGSEVTRNAVLASPEHGVKASLRSPWMLPRIAIIDSELTHDLPRALTAATGLDALTQLIEPYVSCRSNALVDAICVEGIRRAASALPRAFVKGQDAAARDDMCLASLFGGLALVNAGLGAVHGFAAPIGGMFRAPHGAVCAVLLPHVMRANLEAGASVERYTAVARLLTGSAAATANEGVAHVVRLCVELEVPPLRTYGILAGDLPVLVEKARQASSMKANPVVLEQAALLSILEAAL